MILNRIEIFGKWYKVCGIKLDNNNEDVYIVKEDNKFLDIHYSFIGAKEYLNEYYGDYSIPRSKCT